MATDDDDWGWLPTVASAPHSPDALDGGVAGEDGMRRGAGATGSNSSGFTPSDSWPAPPSRSASAGGTDDDWSPAGGAAVDGDDGGDEFKSGAAALDVLKAAEESFEEEKRFSIRANQLQAGRRTSPGVSSEGSEFSGILPTGGGGGKSRPAAPPQPPPAGGGAAVDKPFATRSGSPFQPAPAAVAFTPFFAARSGPLGKLGSIGSSDSPVEPLASLRPVFESPTAGDCEAVGEQALGATPSAAPSLPSGSTPVVAAHMRLPDTPATAPGARRKHGGGAPRSSALAATDGSAGPAAPLTAAPPDIVCDKPVVAFAGVASGTSARSRIHLRVRDPGAPAAAGSVTYAIQLAVVRGRLPPPGWRYEEHTVAAALEDGAGAGAERVGSLAEPPRGVAADSAVSFVVQGPSVFHLAPTQTVPVDIDFLPAYPAMYRAALLVSATPVHGLTTAAPSRAVFQVPLVGYGGCSDLSFAVTTPPLSTAATASPPSSSPTMVLPSSYTNMVTLKAAAGGPPTRRRFVVANRSDRAAFVLPLLGSPSVVTAGLSSDALLAADTDLGRTWSAAGWSVGVEPPALVVPAQSRRMLDVVLRPAVGRAGACSPACGDATADAGLAVLWGDECLRQRWVRANRRQATPPRARVSRKGLRPGVGGGKWVADSLPVPAAGTDDPRFHRDDYSVNSLMLAGLHAFTVLLKVSGGSGPSAVAGVCRGAVPPSPAVLTSADAPCGSKAGGGREWHFPVTPVGQSTTVRIPLWNDSQAAMTATMTPLSGPFWLMASGRKVRSVKLRLRPRSMLELPVKFKPKTEGGVFRCHLRVQATVADDAAATGDAENQPAHRPATVLACDATLVGESCCA